MKLFFPASELLLIFNVCFLSIKKRSLTFVSYFTINFISPRLNSLIRDWYFFSIRTIEIDQNCVFHMIAHRKSEKRVFQSNSIRMNTIWTHDWCKIISINIESVESHQKKFILIYLLNEKHLQSTCAWCLLLSNITEPTKKHKNINEIYSNGERRENKYRKMFLKHFLAM